VHLTVGQLHTHCTDKNHEKGILKMGNFLQSLDVFLKMSFFSLKLADYANLGDNFDNIFLGIFVSVVRDNRYAIQLTCTCILIRIVLCKWANRPH